MKGLLFILIYLSYLNCLRIKTNYNWKEIISNSFEKIWEYTTILEKGDDLDTRNKRKQELGKICLFRNT